MGNYICALILFTAVLIFTAVNSFVICSICDDMISLIDEGKIEEAVSVWESKRDYIALFVRDTEIDAVNAEAEAVAAKNAEDSEAEIKATRLREAIIELQSSERPSFQTIFSVSVLT